jgi:hypothetical protein
MNLDLLLSTRFLVGLACLRRLRLACFTGLGPRRGLSQRDAIVAQLSIDAILP